MADRISILVEAYTSSEYADVSAEFAVIYLSKEDIKSIKKILPFLKEHKLDTATSWELGDVGFYPNPVAGCDMHAAGNAEADGLEDFNGELSVEGDYIATEGGILHIRSNGRIFFSDLLKHTDVRFESTAISIEEVETCLAMKLEDASKYLKDKSRMIKSYATKLLAQGD